MTSERVEKLTRLDQPDDLTGVTSDTGGTQFTNPNGDDLVVHVNVDTADGTNPTLDVKLQEWDPNGGEWVDTGDSFSQITGTGTNRNEFEHPLGSNLRLFYTTGGTNPSFDFHSTVYKIPTDS